jgi:hypothetical protein
MCNSQSNRSRSYSKQNSETIESSYNSAAEFTQTQVNESCTPEISCEANTSSINPVKEFDSKVSNPNIELLRTWSIKPFIAVIRFYQLYISPLTPPTCRFTPTCSNYALDAYRYFGLWGGTWRTLNRLLRCHPWHAGGYDPVISHEKKN